MKKHLTEVKYDENFNFKFGTQEYTKKKMTSLEILNLAMAYLKTPITKVVGRKIDDRVNSFKDLQRLTGKEYDFHYKRLDKAKKPALLVHILKDKLMDTKEYVDLYKNLVTRTSKVADYVNNGSASAMQDKHAAKIAAQDMDETVTEAKKADLGFGKLGNGTTVYNKAVEVNGDYKTIAHISDNGKITWRIKKIPSDVKKEVEAMAKRSNESVNEAMDSSKKFKIYNGLNKGDKIDIKYDSAVARGSEYRTFVVIKGKFKVGKQKIERVTLRLEDNPRGVKFYLYNRNKNVQMAIGDMAASIVDMKPSSNESVNEGKSLADMKKSANKFKKELAQLKKDLKKSPNNTSIEGRKEAKEEQLRRVATAIRNARADKHESVNEDFGSKKERDANDFYTLSIGEKLHKKFKGGWNDAYFKKLFSNLFDNASRPISLIKYYSKLFGIKPNKYIDGDIIEDIDFIKDITPMAREFYEIYSKTNESVNEVQKVNPESKKFLKGMNKIKVKGLGGWMPGSDYVYHDEKTKKFWFVDHEGDYSELRNIGTLKQLRKLHGSSINEATSKITMNNLDWGKSTSERNSNLDKYNSLKTDKEKETFKRKLKNESVNEGIEAFDERHVSNHTIIMLRNGNETRSLIFKKGVENKYNRNNKKDLETMWGLAKKFGQKPITEADGEEPQVIQDIRWVLDNKQNKKVKDPKTGKAMRVDLYSSSAIIKVYDALSKSSREKYVASGIPKMAGMAFKLLK